jgi:membrane protease subunit HflC
MRKLPDSAVRAAAAAAAVVVLLRAAYIVDTGEHAIRTRFGKVVEVVTEPGLHLRVPLLDDVTRLDARLLYFDVPTGEFLTQDKKNVVVTAFLAWRIADPLRFLQVLYTRENAEARLADLVTSELGSKLGSIPFSRLVSSEPGEARLAEETAAVVARLKERAAADYGIDVADLGLRRLAFPDQNRQSVFNRMRAERERIARRYRSEGEEGAMKIRAEAERDRARILAEAYRLAAELRGKGEAEAARIYADATAKDPELYKFLRTLEAYDKLLDEKSTVVLPSDSGLLRLLMDGTGARNP